MAEVKAGQGQTLEMRVAALEDKLSKLNITEEEMRAYEKVSALMGTGMAPGATSPQLSPQVCTISPRMVFCWPPPRGIIRPIIRGCECTCGPCACDPFSSTGFGGGFGSFGM